MKQELTLSPDPAITIVELRHQLQDALDNLSQDGIRHLYDRLQARIETYVAARGDTLCIDMTVLAPITVMCFSFGLNL